MKHINEKIASVPDYVPQEGGTTIYPSRLERSTTQGGLKKRGKRMYRIDNFNWNQITHRLEGFAEYDSHHFCCMSLGVDIFLKKTSGFYIINNKAKQVLLDTHFEPESWADFLADCKDKGINFELRQI